MLTKTPTEHWVQWGCAGMWRVEKLTVTEERATAEFMRSTESDRSRVLIVFKSQFLFTAKTLFALSWLQNLIQYLLHLVFHTAPWWQYTASTWTCTVFCIFASVQTFTFESCCISSFELLYQPFTATTFCPCLYLIMAKDFSTLFQHPKRFVQELFYA